MNYLAHIYLSGDDDAIKIGNFIADFIYGSQYENFSKSIQKGILLHRKIDTYTDKHKIFRQSKKRLFSEFRHYSAVIVDMFYDHFLAKHFEKYSQQRLEDFASDFYNILETNQNILPIKVKAIIPVMKKYNWLSSYKNIDNLEDILNQMNNKTQYETMLHLSIDNLIKNYDLFENEFFLFFNDILIEKSKMFKQLNIN